MDRKPEVGCCTTEAFEERAAELPSIMVGAALAGAGWASFWNLWVPVDGMEVTLADILRVVAGVEAAIVME